MMGGESNFKPVINLGNSIVGVSILAIPYCFAQCGVLLGVLLVVFNALMTIWSCKMLIRAANMTRSHTYETLALAVFGKTGKLAIEISIIALNIGTCIAYFVIIGDLAPPVIAKVTGIDISPNTLRALILVISATFVAFPLGLLRNIDSLSAVSILSLIFYASLTVEVVYLSSGNIRSGVWRSKFVWWNNAGLFKCLPIVSLAFACHTQMFVIYSSLHDPGVRKMSQITERALCLILSIYSMVGLFGYIAYCEVEIKGDILSNFSLDFTSQLTRLGFACSVVMSFPLMIFPCRASINSLFCSQAPNELHVQEPIPWNRFVCITAGIVTSTVIIAILIPNIETVLGLTGATTGSLISFIFPGLLFLKVAGSNADFSNRAKLVLAIGFISMVLSTAVVLQAESTRSEIQPHVDLDVDANKPDIIKLPPLPPQVAGEKNIDDKGVNDKIQDKGGGGVVDGDKEQRKEPPLPQEVAAKPQVEGEEEGVAKPAEPEKPVEPVKLDNPGDNVINIPPDGGEVKQKPADPDLPELNKKAVEKEEVREEDRPLKEVKQPQLPEVKDTGERDLGAEKVEVGKAVMEDKAKESDKGDRPGENEVKKGDSEHLEKHLEKLSNRVDQLEEENRELREKQEVIQRIQIQQEGEQDGNVEQAKVVAPAQDVAPKEVERRDLHQENKVIQKESDTNVAVEPADGNAAAPRLDVDKQQESILEALEKEDDRVERGINEQLVKEKENALAVEDLMAAAGDEQGLGGAGDTHVEEGKAKEEEKRDKLDSKIEIAAVHHVEKEELGENAGNIAAPVRERDVGDEKNVPPQDSMKYRKRDLKNALESNGNLLSR